MGRLLENGPAVLKIREYKDSDEVLDGFQTRLGGTVRASLEVGTKRTTASHSLLPPRRPWLAETLEYFSTKHHINSRQVAWSDLLLPITTSPLHTYRLGIEKVRRRD